MTSVVELLLHKHQCIYALYFEDILRPHPHHIISYTYLSFKNMFVQCFHNIVHIDFPTKLRKFMKIQTIFDLC